jgi:hypothetical protein
MADIPYGVEIIGGLVLDMANPRQLQILQFKLPGYQIWMGIASHSAMPRSSRQSHQSASEGSMFDPLN